MKLSTQFMKTAGIWASLALLMSLTRPESLPVIFLIVPFVLLYAAFVATWQLIGLSVVRYRGGEGDAPRKKLGMAVSLGAVLLVILQSLGQLTLRDIVTVVAILSLGYLYVTRSKISIGRK